VVAIVNGTQPVAEEEECQEHDDEGDDNFYAVTSTGLVGSHGPSPIV